MQGGEGCDPPVNVDSLSEIGEQIQNRLALPTPERTLQSPRPTMRDEKKSESERAMRTVCVSSRHMFCDSLVKLLGVTWDGDCA
jgi:hypothetical protein